MILHRLCIGEDECDRVRLSLLNRVQKDVMMRVTVMGGSPAAGLKAWIQDGLLGGSSIE